MFSPFGYPWHQTRLVGRVFHRRRLDPLATHFRGRYWVLKDLDALALAIADLALGQWAHVEAILRTSGDWIEADANYAIDAAVHDLTVPAGKDPWHRDGWMFQMISWIVAVEAGAGPARPPQMDLASKGFDGLHLRTSRDGSKIKRLIIFEDKATDSPRDTVRDDVWPSFAKLEKGERNHALAAELAYLVERVEGADPREAVNQVMRSPEGRAYRVSITVGRHHGNAPEFNGLFNGYEGVVSGDRRRRYANVFEIEPLRAWMADLATRAIALLEARR